MPDYYNLSLYSTTENIIEIYAVTDVLMKGMFSLFLVTVLFVFILSMRMRKDEEINNALIISSFYSLMLALVLYASNVYYSGIAKPGLYLYIPALIIVTSSAVKWYSNR